MKTLKEHLTKPASQLVIIFSSFVILGGIGSHLFGEDPIAFQIAVWLLYIIVMAMILLLNKMSRRSFANILAQDRPWLKTLGQSVIVCIVATLAFLMSGALLSITGISMEQADMSQYDFIRGNWFNLILALCAVYIISSFGEELIFRAFLISRLEKLIPNAKGRNIIYVLISGVVFGIIHFTWGWVGILQTTFMGLVMASSYIYFKRNIWVVVLAHVYMDTVLLVQMY